MFPEETHVKIVKRVDAIEAEVYSLYIKLQRLRLDLQSQWKVLPSDERWTEEKHQASAYSEKG